MSLTSFRVNYGRHFNITKGSFSEVPLKRYVFCLRMFIRLGTVVQPHLINTHLHKCSSSTCKKDVALEEMNVASTFYMRRTSYLRRVVISAFLQLPWVSTQCKLQRQIQSCCFFSVREKERAFQSFNGASLVAREWSAFICYLENYQL